MVIRISVSISLDPRSHPWRIQGKTDRMRNCNSRFALREDLPMLKLGLIQMRCSMNPAENLDKAEAMIRHAASHGAQIVCLQEIFSTVYFCQVEDHRFFRFGEPIPGPTTTRFGEVAKELDVV